METEAELEIWFRSDDHFGHVRVATEFRGFASVYEHDEELVRRHNAVVQPTDTVWFLGDVGLVSRQVRDELQLQRLTPTDYILSIVSRMRGVKHLVAGNHDEVHPMHKSSYKKQRRWMDVFDSIQPFSQRKYDKKALLLSHFPYTKDHTSSVRYAQWRLPDIGLPLVHGHTHSSDAGDAHEIHVGLDARGLAPIPLHVIARQMKEA